MATTVGWQNEQLQEGDGKVAAKGKGNQGNGKAQRQPRKQASERKLAVQAAEKDIKRGRTKRKGRTMGC